MKINVARLPHAANLPLPEYQSREAAALDLLAAVDWDHPVTLTPGARALIPTGLMFELPGGVEGQVRPRSGLAVKHGVTVLNSPGTIDSDYRGEVKVLLINLSEVSFEIRRGERIAQLVIAPITRVQLKEVEPAQLTQTERGQGGFGSTGRASANASESTNERGRAAKVISNAGQPKTNSVGSKKKVVKKP